MSLSVLYQPDEFPLSPLHTLPKITLALHHINTFTEIIETASVASGWSFFERCTLGTTLKVPFLGHDFSAATGKQLDESSERISRIPILSIKLAPPVLEEMLFEEVSSCQEQDDFSSADIDELLEVLTTYECRKKVSAAILPDLLNELSHEELVQKTTFLIDCWREITQLELHLNYAELTKMYYDLKPTPKKIVGNWSFRQG